MTTRDEKHTGLHHTADKVQDTIGGMHGRVKAKTLGSHSGEAFAKNAAIGDIYEITAAKMALKRTRSDRVREAARKMIDDHTTATHQLRSAHRMSETGDLPELPTEVDMRRRKWLEHLEAAPDDKFDETYLDQQVLAHKETVDLMTGYAQSGDNWQLRSFAEGTAPVVERHLAMMEKLRAAL
ncbi:DUF4142 domain-containing protein [Aurantiacibacter poecillastricola]|uniref:DUF4142 domain-containing protein n=1 Tax=Aurantiacibacter poecillastricola TaxID=3064385 RepID=UPI00273F2EBB|nr:DUF4142 domain-containing protein [Aurantiacibacter sp. 219JJ12-13]MDP5260237.1 DUF4142 domain-containing protein [Aurantiacibacter sp. 219JJ12-13]